MIGAMIAILVVIGGSFSLAVQSSLPGDVLYPVKAHMAEDVHAALNSRDAASVDGEIEQTPTRSQEAGEVSAESNIDVKARAQVEADSKDGYSGRGAVDLQLGL